MDERICYYAGGVSVLCIIIDENTQYVINGDTIAIWTATATLRVTDELAK